MNPEGCPNLFRPVLRLKTIPKPQKNSPQVSWAAGPERVCRVGYSGLAKCWVTADLASLGQGSVKAPARVAQDLFGQVSVKAWSRPGEVSGQACSRLGEDLIHTCPAAFHSLDQLSINFVPSWGQILYEFGLIGCQFWI